jgi:hypothetical protein
MNTPFVFPGETQTRDRAVSGSLPERDCLQRVAYLYLCPCFEYARGSSASQEAKTAVL